MSPKPEIRTYRMPPNLRRELLDKVAAVLFEHPEILFAYAHGSFVRGGPFRDLDLAVYLDRGLPPSRFVYEDGLSVEVTEALHPGFPVDVHILDGAALAFQHHACRGSLLLDRNPERRATVMAHIASRYLDLKPILEHHAREAFGHASGS